MTTIQSTQAAGASTNPAPQAAQNGGVIGSDFETFLIMLTAQIQNQDPLNPMDSSEYAVQLATFAGVEQQVLTNQLLQSQGLGGMELSTYAGWVGMEAQHDGPIYFDGTPVSLVLPEETGETKRELVISSAQGDILRRVDVTGSDTNLSWDGMDSNGQALLQGSYIAQLTATYPEGQTEIKPISSYTRVNEVRTGADGVEIVLASGTAISTDAVRALREDI
ncbi:MAG: flagellar hook capping FlgD N-terminal domain-containing protein [Qingshengfaniella sp.]